VSWAAFARNGLVAVILLLLVATVEEADLPFTHGVEEYLVFVLTTEFDYGPWLAYLEERLPDLSWLPVLGGSLNSPADDPPR